MVQVIVFFPYTEGKEQENKLTKMFNRKSKKLSTKQSVLMSEICG